jgi:hypothetical protein
MAMKAVAFAFIALQALAALAMLVLSVHAPSGLAVAAPLYLAAAAALTWWTARKSWWLLLATGAAMLAAPPAIYGLLDFAEQTANRNRVAATQVSEVADEPILSAAGQPVGVRLSFSVVAPQRGYFGITPWLYPLDEAARNMTLQPLRWRFDGRPGPPDLGPFEPGQRHRLEFELYPPILFITGKGERCLVNHPSPALPRAKPGPLLVEIHETPYGSPWRGGREQPTRGIYDLAGMYRAVAEGLPPCKVPGQ